MELGLSPKVLVRHGVNAGLSLSEVLGFPAEDIRARGCDGPSDFGFLAATGAS
jgi:hypothetical protein